jgi:hypothetical protein
MNIGCGSRGTQTSGGGVTLDHAVGRATRTFNFQERFTIGFALAL